MKRNFSITSVMMSAWWWWWWWQWWWCHCDDVSDDVSVMMMMTVMLMSLWWCKWWCQRDDVSVMMSAWWCQCDDDSVMMSVMMSAWWCQRDDVSVMMSAWWCQWWCQHDVWTAVDHEEETEQVKSGGFIPEVDTEAQWRLTFHSDCCNKLFHSVRPKISHMMFNTTSSQTLQHIRIISNIWELHWTSSQMFHHWFCSENSEIRSVMED